MITHSAKETGQQKEQLGWRLEVTGKWGWLVGQNLKKEGEVSTIGGSSWKGGLEPLSQICKETKNFPSLHYKTNSLPILGFPPFLVNIFHPPIRAIFEKLNFIPHPLYEGGWEGSEYVNHVISGKAVFKSLARRFPHRSSIGNTYWNRFLITTWLELNVSKRY